MNDFFMLQLQSQVILAHFFYLFTLLGCLSCVFFLSFVEYNLFLKTEEQNWIFFIVFHFMHLLYLTFNCDVKLSPLISNVSTFNTFFSCTLTTFQLFLSFIEHNEVFKNHRSRGFVCFIHLSNKMWHLCTSVVQKRISFSFQKLTIYYENTIRKKLKNLLINISKKHPVSTSICPVQGSKAHKVAGGRNENIYNLKHFHFSWT